MMRTPGAGLALFLITALPAGAQTANTAGTPPGTVSAAPGLPAPHQVNQADRTFVEQLAIGNEAEIALGQLAVRKAHAQAAKQLGQHMVDDHTKAGRALADRAKAVGVPLPAGLDAEHRALGDRLATLNGAAFDAAYTQAQVEDHQKTVQLLEYEIGSGQDKDLRAFAAEMLPTIRQHLAMAQGVALAAAAQAPAAAPPPGTTTPAPPADTPAVAPDVNPQTPPAPAGHRR